MCGIVGAVSTDSLESCDFSSALQAMIHRGPDAQSIQALNGATLGFCRLAIIDLSPVGNQPMCNETEDVWLVFNGEIYNFAELRSELEHKHQFRSHTDSEVLIHGYEEWGIEGLLKRIYGMYGFAIWDGRTRDLFLARDRGGKKPLFYTELSDGVAFASTLNALRPLLPWQPRVDPVALDQYLVYQAVPAPRTIYDGVYALPPAHYAHLRPGRPLELHRYWDLSYRNKVRRSEQDVIEEMDHLLRKAVQRRLVADVPLGAFLSGGVDSSLMVGIMSDLGAGPVQAINIGFDDPNFDERPFAQAVADRWKADLHAYVLKPNEMQNLPSIIWHYGQPHADVSIVPTYAVAREARRHVTVVLNGDGGDEGFGGYARPVVAHAAENIRRWTPGPLRRLAVLAAGRLGKQGKVLARALEGNPRDAFTYDRGLRPLREKLYNPHFLACMDEHPDELHRAAWRHADGPTDADRVLYADFTRYLPDQLLSKMDVSTMAHSVEARSPLLDTHLLEFAATIPTDQMLTGHTPKYLLKRLAERYVPHHVLHRRKRGFVMPAATWLRTDLRAHARALLATPQFLGRGLMRPDVVLQMLEEHETGVHNWGDPIWTLMMLEIWFRLFVDHTLCHNEPLDAVL